VVSLLWWSLAQSVYDECFYSAFSHTLHNVSRCCGGAYHEFLAEFSVFMDQSHCAADDGVINKREREKYICESCH
jgi:dihydroorotase-like cyclic amidohydrolase